MLLDAIFTPKARKWLLMKSQSDLQIKTKRTTFRATSVGFAPKV
jgi:hypothetical protein